MKLIPTSPAARRWLWIVLAVIITAGGATALVLQALQEKVSYYKTPTELAVLPAGPQHIRMGGLVKKDTVVYNGTMVFFVVTDGVSDIHVGYAGLLPDLFREGQGVVAEGKMTGKKEFTADRLLAKHDENYMPPDVARALNKAPK